MALTPAAFLHSAIGLNRENLQKIQHVIARHLNGNPFVQFPGEVWALSGPEYNLAVSHQLPKSINLGLIVPNTIRSGLVDDSESLTLYEDPKFLHWQGANKRLNGFWSKMVKGPSPGRSFINVVLFGRSTVCRQGFTSECQIMSNKYPPYLHNLASSSL